MCALLLPTTFADDGGAYTRQCLQPPLLPLIIVIAGFEYLLPGNTCAVSFDQSKPGKTKMQVTMGNYVARDNLSQLAVITEGPLAMKVTRRDELSAVN